MEEDNMEMGQESEMESESKPESEDSSETAFIPSSVCKGSFKPGDTISLKVVAVEDDGTIEVKSSGSEPKQSYEEEIDNLPEDE